MEAGTLPAGRCSVATDQSGFLAELKRRHVWRVAIAYTVAGWLLLQVATQVFPFFDIPNWVVRLVVVLLVLGFPVAVALAWVYELTADGIRRTAPAESPDARPQREYHQIGRKLNAVIVVTLVLAVALLGWRLHVVRHTPTPVASSVGDSIAAAEVARIASPVPAKSIAVLPFENLSNDKDNEYFVAGMQDLILTKLADIGDLKVISRTSTEKYKSRPDNLRLVGEQLGVATILEGSVQKAGNQVLVNVQLIDTRNDSHLWAQSYQRTLDNIFGVEGEVAEKIAAALNARLSGAENASLAAVPTTNKGAMDLFLHAEFKFNKGFTNYDTAGLKGAVSLYRQAIGQDPDFALAYARLSHAESLLAWFGGGGEDVRRINQQARADAERALQLAPNEAATQLALGFSAYYGRSDYTGALEAFARALKLKPNDTGALAAQGYVERRQGRFDAAIASFQRAITNDPRNSSLAVELGSTCMMASRYGEAVDWLQRALALDPDNLNAKSIHSNAILLGTGDVPRALQAAQGDAPAMVLTRANLLFFQRQYREALTLLDSVPDTPDNFDYTAGSKALQQAVLYRLLGNAGAAQPLYRQALDAARQQFALQQGIIQAFVQLNIAAAELGLGHPKKGVDAITMALASSEQSSDQVYGPQVMSLGANLYAEAGRGDLAVPLIERAFGTPGIGQGYAPVMLWLDPAWDPIRHDPLFVALLQKYGQYKPAVTYEALPEVSRP